MLSLPIPALGAREVEGGTTKYKLEQTGIIERQN
jgi:hypothetical protein